MYLQILLESNGDEYHGLLNSDLSYLLNFFFFLKSSHALFFYHLYILNPVIHLDPTYPK